MIILNNEVLDTFNFPNGERGIKLPVLYGINTFVLHYQSDQDLMDLMFVRKHIENIGLPWPSVDLVITYMPYSRMDRTNNDYIFTLKYACEFINSLKFDTVYVVEPHSDVTCALLDRARPVWIVEHIVERVKKAIDFNDEKDYLVFPDAGAAKRYENLQTARSYVGFKLRDFKTGDIIKHSFVEVGVNADYLPVTNGCKALIIDDLCSRGATFIAASKELRKLGFAEVHLLVAHCEENVYTGSLFDYVDSVHATTSLQVESQHPKLHLHPIEDLLYECL